MSPEQLGITVTPAVTFAFPLPGGRWATVPGTVHVVDGFVHKVAFPGFETRSGEAFGLTATFHVVDRGADGRGAGIVQWTVVTGRVQGMDTVAEGVELVDASR